MTRVKTILGAIVVAFIVVGSAGSAFAGNVADNEGFCKKVQGSCSGASECAGPHESQLPGGRAKRC